MQTVGPLKTLRVAQAIHFEMKAGHETTTAVDFRSPKKQ